MLRRLNIFVDPKDLKRFNALAKKQKVTTAHLIRVAMTEYLAKQK